MVKYKIIPKKGMAIFEKDSSICAIIGSDVLFADANRYIDSNYTFNTSEIARPWDEHVETHMLGERVVLDKVDGEYRISSKVINKIKIIRF